MGREDVAMANLKAQSPRDGVRVGARLGALDDGSRRMIA
jgi:hypothetical protein